MQVLELIRPASDVGLDYNLTKGCGGNRSRDYVCATCQSRLLTKCKTGDWLFRQATPRGPQSLPHSTALGRMVF